MQINAFSLYNTPTSAKQSATASANSVSSSLKAVNIQAPVVQQSSLAALSARTGWTEVSTSSDRTSFIYRSDGSLALQAQTSFDLSMRSQDTQIELTLSADNFKAGLFSPDAFKNGPIQLEIKYWNDSQQIETHTNIQQVKTLRSVQDILQDIGSALGDVLNRDGDKNVSLQFDEEAIRTLFADPKVKDFIKELTALICMLNSLSTHGGPRDFYTIRISGKGKPYLDERQSTSVQAVSDHIDIKLTILPPQSTGSSPALQLAARQAVENQ